MTHVRIVWGELLLEMEIAGPSEARQSQYKHFYAQREVTSAFQRIRRKRESTREEKGVVKDCLSSVMLLLYIHLNSITGM